MLVCAAPCSSAFFTPLRHHVPVLAAYVLWLQASASAGRWCSLQHQHGARTRCPPWPAVGEYRALVLSVEGQPKLSDRLIAALGLQKGWPEARQHALSAVQPDFLARCVPCRRCGARGGLGKRWRRRMRRRATLRAAGVSCAVSIHLLLSPTYPRVSATRVQHLVGRPPPLQRPALLRKPGQPTAAAAHR